MDKAKTVKKVKVTGLEIQRRWDTAQGWSNPIDVQGVFLEWH
jgi:hypothetical protein